MDLHICNVEFIILLTKKGILPRYVHVVRVSVYRIVNAGFLLNAFALAVMALSNLVLLIVFSLMSVNGFAM